MNHTTGKTIICSLMILGILFCAWHFEAIGALWALLLPAIVWET